MIAIDPAVVSGWRRGGERNALRLELDDPVGAWPALCDVLDEVPSGWSEVLVTPGALLFCRVADDAGPELDEVVSRLGERGVGTGRLTVDRDADATQPGALLDLAETTSWVAAWLVPLMVPGLSFTYRTLREWRIRRFPADRLVDVATDLVASSPVKTARVGWSGGALELPAAQLPGHVRHWMEHGITTTSALGEVLPEASVLVTSVRRGTELLGIGQAGVGLIDDRPRATALLEQLTELIVDLADVLAYAVVGVHETGREPALGTPFRETEPATARARSRGLSLAALDQWVLDAAPVQLLSPHHHVSGGEGVVEELLANGRRLVRIGTPDDWFSGPASRTQVRNRGRQALAACLPPPKTSMPAPLL